MTSLYTIGDIFKNRALQFGDKPCIVASTNAAPGTEQTLNGAELYQLLTVKSQLFCGPYQLQTGDTIALLADNSLEYLVAAYSAVIAGMSVLLISTKTLPEHIGSFTERSRCRRIICSDDYRDLLNQSGISNDVSICDIRDFAPGSQQNESPSTNYPKPAIKDTDTAIILHTSGTSSTPKLVYLSHRNILCNQQSTDNVFATVWQTQDTTLGWLPLYHGYALLAEFLRDILVGSTYVLYTGQEQMTAGILLDAVEKHGVSVLCCVPWMLSLLAERIREEESHQEQRSVHLLQSLNFIITGGSSLGETLAVFFQQRNIRVVTMFGLSEASGFVLHSSLQGDNWDLLQANAFSGVDFIPLDSNKAEHELVISNPDLFTSRVLTEHQQADKQPTSAEPLHTGDLFVSENGGWRYVGRNDQMFNGAHGEKVNPVLFEAALEQLAAVQRVFVYGHELPYNIALIELLKGYDADESRKAIRQHAQNHINPALDNPDRVYPADFIFLDQDEALPLTPKGSVNRKQAAVLARSKLLAANQSDTSRLADAAQINAIFFSELLNYYTDANDPKTTAHSLLELGFDSLMTLSLRNSLQDRLGFTIPLDLMLGYLPIAEFLQALLPLHAEAQQQLALVPAQNPQTDIDGWHGISIEQAIFHMAYYLFPGPTFGGSFSLLAPDKLSTDRIKSALAFLERHHEVLRCVYRQDGTYNIADYSMIERAFISHSSITGPHDLNNNQQAQELIRLLMLEPYNFADGPTWRYATADIHDEACDASNKTRTLVYIGINHIIGDFRSFSLMVREFMQFCNGSISDANTPVDTYRQSVSRASSEQIQQHSALMQTLLTSGNEVLPKDRDLREGARVRFDFRHINLVRLGDILKQHQLSLFNTVYAAWVIAASRHIDDLELHDFPSTTSVTTRVSSKLETLMGCFVHTPVYRFHLSADDSMLSCAQKIQQTTRAAFTGVITDPINYFSKAMDDQRNHMPILKRNVFLYRSPDEISDPVPGWCAYRNDYFEERCNLGAYFDFCANKAQGYMEGYLTVNLYFCSRQTAEQIVADIEKIVLQMFDSPQLDFMPGDCI